MLRSLIAALLILLVLSKPNQQKKPAVVDVRDIDLSGNDTKTSFQIKDLDPAKSVMIIVEQSPQLVFSPFQITITQGSKWTYCSFKFASNLCAFQHITNQVKAQIACLDTKCKFTIAISQRTAVNVKDDLDFKKKIAVPGQIFRFSQRQYNTILEIYAERDEHKVLSDQITIFSNVHAFPLHQVEELDRNSAIFGLKPMTNDNEQYIYIESRSKKSEHFNTIFRSHNGELRDSINIVDFIENYGKYSQINYTFVGTIHKNLQINVRVFSPRDPKGIPLTLTVTGRKEEKSISQVIRSLKLDPIDFNGDKFYDFTFAIRKSVHGAFQFIDIQMQLDEVENKSIFFELQAREADSFEINIFDHIFFGSNAKQELHFTVEPQVKLELADGDKDIQLLTNANQKYFSNTSSCSLHKGCEIVIKAENVCQSCSFKFNLKDEDVMNHVIYYEVKEGMIEGKVDLQEEIYFKYAMNGKGVTQIIVNSNNVVIYAVFDNYQRCKIPTASCHEFAINQHNPLVITNKDEQPAELIVGVVGLAKTSFKVRFLNKLNGLLVQLGEKFSYLMDGEQKDMELRFELPKDFKEQLHFNLISPIHSTRLTITNGQSKLTSSDGYITLRPNEILNDLFVIKVEKINLYYDEYLHFTLFVTSSNASPRLDSTSTHYEKYNPKAVKKFLMEYEPFEVNAINIYTENLQKVKGKMILQIRDPNFVQEGQENVAILTRELVRDYEFIMLQNLNICEDLNCELQLTIKSSADVSLEQSITLMSQESVISLDDSIWSVFQINELSRHNHFYFIPRHQNKSINILFNTDDNHLYINFRIFNTKHSINPIDWPFDHKITQDAGHIANSQQINIAADDKEIMSCWPNCVILININEAFQPRQSLIIEHTVIKSYKILATNSIVELFEDIKIQFSLRSEEQKQFFIMLQKDINFEELTFFTYYSIGRAKITAATVYDNKEYPVDVQFKDLQTRIEKWDVMHALQQDYPGANNILLKITIKAETTLKMTLEYTSYFKNIRRLNMDQINGVTLSPGRNTMFEFIPQRDFTFKLYRHEGFPIFKIFKCSQSNYIECLNKNRRFIDVQLSQFLVIQQKIKKSLDNITVNDSPKTDQIQVFVQKTYSFSGEQCEQCVYFFWLYCFQGNLGLTMNLRSKYSEVELKEKQSFLQTAYPGSYNRYLINMVHGQRAIISVKIYEGAANIIISTGKNALFNQTLDVKNQFKQFTIDGEDDNNDLEDDDNEQKIEKTGQIRKIGEKHVFKHAHVTVSSIGDKPVDFYIYYSVGTSSLFLQDGVIIQRDIDKTPISFFYRNKNQKEHAYLTLSAELKDLQFTQSITTISPTSILSVKFYYYPDAGDRKVKELFQPERPPKRNENYLGGTYSTIYELPAKYELYEIQVEANAFSKLTASINHQQLVYLPLGFEYLIKLHPAQSLNLVIDNPEADYLQVKVKKCDLSSPMLQYTNDANEFKRGIFEAEVPISNNNFKQYLKTKKDSNTIHLKFIASANADALFTVSVEGRGSQFIESDSTKFKAGGNGIVSYKMIQSDIVQVIFKPIICENNDCNNPVNYFLVIAKTIDELFGELNCAGTYFVPQAKQLIQKIQTEIVEIGIKDFDAKQKQYKYRIKLQESQQFLGVKAVVSGTKEEIQYIPIEIHNIWGELSKVSFGIVIMVSLALALILTIAIVVSTKLARRGYKPISSQE